LKRKITWNQIGKESKDFEMFDPPLRQLFKISDSSRKGVSNISLHQSPLLSVFLVDF
jgi:hypothetical protein